MRSFHRASPKFNHFKSQQLSVLQKHNISSSANANANELTLKSLTTFALSIDILSDLYQSNPMNYLFLHGAPSILRDAEVHIL